MAECLPPDFGGPTDRPFEAFPESAVQASIADRFEAIAKRFPDRLAIQDQANSFTYRELGALVARIGAATASLPGSSSGPIGILLGRDARYPAAMLGVLSGRGVYAAWTQIIPSNAIVQSPNSPVYAPSSLRVPPQRRPQPCCRRPFRSLTSILSRTHQYRNPPSVPRQRTLAISTSPPALKEFRRAFHIATAICCK